MLIENWLRTKGVVSGDGASLQLLDGRVAQIARTAVSTAEGTSSEFVLTEPTAGGWIRTTMAIAETPGVLVVSVVLAAGSNSLAPLVFDLRCPRIVRSLLGLPIVWRYGHSVLRAAALTFSGDQGGDDFVALTWDPERSVPIIAVSDEYGAVLHPGIVEALASDLAGLAIVARINPGASWRVSARKGKQWSCYGGAIRLYWPRFEDQPSSYLAAPLWTARRLLEGVADTETAASRIRTQLRQRVFSQAAFAVGEHDIFARLRRLARQEELEAFRNRAASSTDSQALAEEYFNEVVRLAAVVEEQDGEIRSLKQALANANLALRWKEEEHGAVEPVHEAPPATVEEAVLQAMEKHGGLLRFGRDVNDGIRTLAPDAGPPDKILSYLDALADLAATKDKGTLGTTTVKWLEDRGVICTGESETIRNDKHERKLRTWDDGSGAARYFELHLKPSDATSPDRCVRIYFDYDQALKKTVVAWVGRKPGL